RDALAALLLALAGAGAGVTYAAGAPELAAALAAGVAVGTLSSVLQHWLFGHRGGRSSARRKRRARRSTGAVALALVVLGAPATDVDLPYGAAAPMHPDSPSTPAGARGARRSGRRAADFEEFGRQMRARSARAVDSTFQLLRERRPGASAEALADLYVRLDRELQSQLRLKVPLSLNALLAADPEFGRRKLDELLGSIDPGGVSTPLEMDEDAIRGQSWLVETADTASDRVTERAPVPAGVAALIAARESGAPLRAVFADLRDLLLALRAAPDTPFGSRLFRWLILFVRGGAGAGAARARLASARPLRRLTRAGYLEPAGRRGGGRGRGQEPHRHRLATDLRGWLRITPADRALELLGAPRGARIGTPPAPPPGLRSFVLRERSVRRTLLDLHAALLSARDEQGASDVSREEVRRASIRPRVSEPGREVSSDTLSRDLRSLVLLEVAERSGRFGYRFARAFEPLLDVAPERLEALMASTEPVSGRTIGELLDRLPRAWTLPVASPEGGLDSVREVLRALLWAVRLEPERALTAKALVGEAASGREGDEAGYERVAHALLLGWHAGIVERSRLPARAKVYRYGAGGPARHWLTRTPPRQVEGALRSDRDVGALLEAWEREPQAVIAARRALSALVDATRMPGALEPVSSPEGAVPSLAELGSTSLAELADWLDDPALRVSELAGPVVAARLLELLRSRSARIEVALLDLRQRHALRDHLRRQALAGQVPPELLRQLDVADLAGPPSGVIQLLLDFLGVELDRMRVAPAPAATTVVTAGELPRLVAEPHGGVPGRRLTEIVATRALRAGADWGLYERRSGRLDPGSTMADRFRLAPALRVLTLRAPGRIAELVGMRDSGLAPRQALDFLAGLFDDLGLDRADLETALAPLALVGWPSRAPLAEGSGTHLRARLVDVHAAVRRARRTTGSPTATIDEVARAGTRTTGSGRPVSNSKIHAGLRELESLGLLHREPGGRGTAPGGRLPDRYSFAAGFKRLERVSPRGLESLLDIREPGSGRSLGRLLERRPLRPEDREPWSISAPASQRAVVRLLREILRAALVEANADLVISHVGGDARWVRTRHGTLENAVTLGLLKKLPSRDSAEGPDVLRYALADRTRTWVEQDPERLGRVLESDVALVREIDAWLRERRQASERAAIELLAAELRGAGAAGRKLSSVGAGVGLPSGHVLLAEHLSARPAQAGLESSPAGDHGWAVHLDLLQVGTALPGWTLEAAPSIVVGAATIAAAGIAVPKLVGWLRGGRRWRSRAAGATAPTRDERTARPWRRRLMRRARMLVAAVLIGAMLAAGQDPLASTLPDSHARQSTSQSQRLGRRSELRAYLERIGVLDPETCSRRCAAGRIRRSR
ncbi:MAG: hypothetical protein ACRDLA_03890, partial [Thermoleophilaceae bacterium]